MIMPSMTLPFLLTSCLKSRDILAHSCGAGTRVFIDANILVYHFNDALTLQVMMDLGIHVIATNDSDFERVDAITAYKT